MGIDFDILEHCKKVRADHGPPYTCPLEKCGRTYKSVCGLQYHLKSYDHDNPTPLPSPSQANSPSTPKNKKGRHKTKCKTPSVPQVEPLTFEEAQKMVQFEVDGHVLRWNINQSLDVIDKGNSIGNEDKTETVTETPIQLPEANFKEIDNYSICDAPPRPNAYIRFIEKSVEELDGEVEYDVDEEDTAWLSIMNEKRESSGLAPVSVDSLELLMDRLEKESYFQASVNGQTGNVVDDDAVCCICMDGECQNTNVILFCDMCNLAVHQDCYGVPYIPEGQWLCRRCLQSPSRAVDCVLCPNQGGAFKQTDRSQWAHVVCALWIPEVRFANTVFLEPIDSIETIPAARWKLTCYVCKQKNVGACIQCHKTNCYSAFHVTCAQQAGLYMKMDTVKDMGDSQLVLVQKIAYCDVHTPADNSDLKKEDTRQKMKQARKLLAKKRTTAPVILIPTIPPERIQEIASLITITKKSQFIQRLIAYWTLKRQYRNGVPLLRRLQSAQTNTNPINNQFINNLNLNNNNNTNCNNIDTIELCKQLKYWQCLRQDLERARLLCELVRKREKLKLELVKLKEKCLNIELKPFETSLKLLLEQIKLKDTNEIFLEPVDLDEVPDYKTIVSEPMDLSTIEKKIENNLYNDLLLFEKDFDLMIANCLAYNNRDTVFYRAAIKMRDQCGILFRNARKEFEHCGFLIECNNGGTSGGSIKNEQFNDDVFASEIDKELENLQGKATPDVVTKLEELLAKSQALKHGLLRAKRVKLVRSELNKVKKTITSSTLVTNTEEDSSQTDNDNDDNQNVTVIAATTTTTTATATTTTMKNTSSSPSLGVSPNGGGVNRRTAVLFTRKAQATLKKISDDDNNYENKQVKRKNNAKNKKHNNDNGNKNELDVVPDSFKVYRAGHQTSADENSDSGTSLSTCYSLDVSEIDTDESEDENENNENESDNSENSSVLHELPSPKLDTNNKKINVKECDDEKCEKSIILKPLQLVWAKCRGYPWYPALIIDPSMPKGYIHKGVVPMPSPPQEVLSLKSNHNEHVYLVLFFDVKRTWQWLPIEKLEILGLDKERDEAKTNEPRKPTDRKAVKKAYENALQYKSQINTVVENEEK